MPVSTAGPLCTSFFMIVAFLSGRGCMARLCPLTHFLEHCPWASLVGFPSSVFFLSMGDMYFGECLSTYFFFLGRGSDRGTCLGFLWMVGVSIKYLLRIFVNALPSHFLLLYCQIM